MKVTGRPGLTATRELRGPVASRIRREISFYRALINDPRTPRSAKWLIGCGVGYMFLPIDLIPDFIPIVGKLDDLLISSFLISLGMKMVPVRVRIEDRHRSRRIRVLEPKRLSEPITFQSDALESSFGMRINAAGHTPESLRALAPLLLSLIDEFKLVVIEGIATDFDPFAVKTVRTVKRPQQSRLLNQRSQLDVNIRLLPLIGAVLYSGSHASSTVRLVNTQAAYQAMPWTLKRYYNSLCLKCFTHNAHPLLARISESGSFVERRNGVRYVSTAQMFNLIMKGNCEISNLSKQRSARLLANFRKHVMRDEFGYTRRLSANEILVWNPRRILCTSSGPARGSLQFVYPASTVNFR